MNLYLYVGIIDRKIALTPLLVVDIQYEESTQVYSPNHTALTTRVYGITSINL